jgi:hypothetical protein
MPSQTPRLVLCGASNLTLGLGLAVDLARARLGGPVDVLAACGLGRSYGVESRVLTRVLPGIDRCGLWSALATRPPTHCVVTDLGNDLAYGTAAKVVARWLEGTLERLSVPGARGSVGGLPLASLRAIGNFEFQFWKAVLFPSRPIERARLLAEAEELEAHAQELAKKFGWSFVESDPSWYGRDPIHHARSQRERAWRALLAPLGGEPAAPLQLSARRGRLEYAEVRRLGMRMGRPQPCATLADGTTFSLY